MVLGQGQYYRVYGTILTQKVSVLCQARKSQEFCEIPRKSCKFRESPGFWSIFPRGGQGGRKISDFQAFPMIPSDSPVWEVCNLW